MGTEIAGYRLETRVRGGSVPLWRAVRESDGFPVAIKLFAAEERSRAQREADLARMVAHRHVLPVIGTVTWRGTGQLADSGTDAPGGNGAHASGGGNEDGPGEAVDDRTAGSDGVGGTDDGGHTTGVGIVTPWASGGSLAAIVSARRRLPWRQTLTVLIAVADALAAAHERGVVHGDLSAGNVLFDGEGRPLVSDLGAARIAAELDAEVSVTPTDVAPEVVRGGDPTCASDLFSLGSVARFCLTGEPAWPAEDLRDVMIASAVGQWPDVPDRMAPGGLLAVVRRLLDPEPQDRGTAAEAAIELRKVGLPEPVPMVGPRGEDDAVLAATVVRADALRPPRLVDAPEQPRRLQGWRRGALIAAPLVVAPAMLAVMRSGLWQGSEAAGMTSSVAAQAERTTLTSPSARSPASDPATVRATESADTADIDWHAIIVELDEIRASALVERDVTLLMDAYVHDSPARVHDSQTISQMLGEGYRVSGAQHSVSSVSVLYREPSGAVRLEVVESQQSYEVIDGSGAVVGETAPQPQAVTLIDLSKTSEGYRIRDITRATS